MTKRLLTWMKDEQGMATVEYALLLALVAVAAIGVWMGLAEKLKAAIATATNSISEPLG